MNIPNGVRNETLENLEFEAGLILKSKYTYGESDIKSLVLCATTGGIKINIGVAKRTIAFDGLKENTAGIQKVDSYTGSVQFTTKEVDSEKVKMAIGYATISEKVSNVTTITLCQGVVPLSEYKDIYILGKKADGTWRQICMEKTMNATGLQETKNDKGETEIAFDLQANYGIYTQDDPPIKIEEIDDAPAQQAQV